ncbi:MAG: metal ABC transporter substrate-binding protein [Gemmataceae bacterium]
MTRYIKRITFALTPLCLILAVGAAGCSATPDPWSPQPGPKVLAFFPPIYSLAASVAGDDAQVLSLLTTKGPHDYEPSRTDARKLGRTDLFLINGLGLDETVAGRLAQTGGSKSLKLVELGEAIPQKTLLEGGCNCGKEAGHDHSHDDGHVHYDPHVWLGIPEAIAMVGRIQAELSTRDPAHAAAYATRAAALIERLTKLQTDGKALLARKTEKPRVLTHHDSMRYFARTFGVEIVDSIEMPGREPTAARLNELVAQCKEKKTRLIAVEPQYSSNTGAQALLKELRRQGMTDAAFVELDPLETADPVDLTADWYERKLMANVDALAKVLK